ncbi:hypothetical protein J6590_089917 [Homalodisca vitripennis]|nr:hypothetical protein J6590_089917 [Homalodisca vitripennis]
MEKRVPTSIEVLEADLKCLRRELRGADSRLGRGSNQLASNNGADSTSRQRKSSTGIE